MFVDTIEALFDGLDKDVLPTPKMVFVTSPNNPDCCVVSDAFLARTLLLLTLFVLDESYLEFCRDNGIRWVSHVYNIAVLRTFSKWADFIGMRVG